MFWRTKISRKFICFDLRSCAFLLTLFCVVVFSACSELEKAKPETFYSDSKPPAKQEFRWSNGKMPKTFDPALASAPPETDIVRAIYDGLTEIDSKSLKANPAVAEKWSSSEDHKVWTFDLRQDAKWSNGEKVTAYDFVSSWKRLSEMGEEVPHFELLKNIVGTNVVEKEPEPKKDKKVDIFSIQESTKEIEKKKQEVIQGVTEKKVDKPVENDGILVKKTPSANAENKSVKEVAKNKEKPVDFGVKAVGNYTLEVKLNQPDKEFPRLVAHPIFRPVYNEGKEFESKTLNADIVTNGAFRIFSVGQDGVTLDRAEYYYNKQNIKLDRVRFVPTEDADSALKAYRSGEIDAVTNADFEPLALKILTPFVDFQRTTHSALNFYEFNRKIEPFNDRRVRQALSISIDRKRLSEVEMDGATKPAFNFLPFDEDNGKENLEQQIVKAKSLLEKAGFLNGDGFPTIRLVINRNNIQQRIAKSVAKMWKDNLNVETEIIVKEFDELETAKNSGEYDVIRRGVVLPTSDETANMLALFSPKQSTNIESIESETAEKNYDENNLNKSQNANTNASIIENSNTNTNTNKASQNLFENELLIDTGEDEKIILTEAEAILEVPGIPLYFPRSYSLVKPYVQGFEMNTLDAPLLKDVQINNNWQPKKTNKES